MARDSIVDALDVCVAEIQAGRATVEDCLARYPQLRAELEPLLSIASGIAAFNAAPDPMQKADSRARFVAALDAATPSIALVTAPPAAVTSLRSNAVTPFPLVAAIADILDGCLDDILAGRATPEECLGRYPDLRAELEPLLAVASHLTRFDLTPDPARRLAARARFIEALYAEPESRGLRGFVAAFLDQAASFRLGLRGAVSMGLALILATSSGAVYASEQALPGAPLYGVKLAVEQVRVATALDEESKAQVELDIASRRLTEVERALELGDQVAVQAAAASYAATMQHADERLERMGERGNQAAATRLESNLDRQQRVLATAVAQAPTDSKGSLEQARGQAQRGIERSTAAANRSSGSGGAGSPVPSTGTSGGATSSGASGATAATPTPTATRTHTAAPTSSPEPTARREATREPTETRREEVVTAVIRRVTAAPTVDSRGRPTVVAVPDNDDKDDKKDDNDRGAGQDGNRGRGAATTIPSMPTVPPVPTVQRRTAATVAPPPTVAVPTQAPARTTVPLPRVTPPRIISSNSDSNTRDNGQVKNEGGAAVAGASAAQPIAGSASPNLSNRTTDRTDRGKSTVKTREGGSSSGQSSSASSKDDAKTKR